MENAVYSSDIVIAQYLADLKLIQLRWKKEATTEEYRKLFETLVNFAEQKKVRFLISDLREQGLVSVDDVKWLEEEILKKAIILGIEKIALVNNDTIFSQVYADTIKRKLSNSPIRVQLFEEPDSAKAWLSAE